MGEARIEKMISSTIMVESTAGDIAGDIATEIAYSME